MFFQQPFCLMVKGSGLNDEMRNLLAQTANTMVLGNEKKRQFRGETAEGVVETDFDAVSVGAFSGIAFRGILETDRGKIKIDFLIRPWGDLSLKMSWSEGSFAQSVSFAKNAGNN